MKLIKAQVTNYRSIIDTGPIDIEPGKTIFVGPNEAGKSAILRALQQINPPADVPKFDELRDYPRSKYNDLTTKKVDPAKTDVAVAWFELSDGEKSVLPEEFRNCIYVCGRRLDNSFWHEFEGDPTKTLLSKIRKDLLRLSGHIDKRLAEGVTKSEVTLQTVLKPYSSSDYYISGELADALVGWLESNLTNIDENDAVEEKRYDTLMTTCKASSTSEAALQTVREQIPVFVLFSNYYRVRPLIHLDHLATRIEQNILDDAQYDYGNQCLLKLLGFTARALSTLGRAVDPAATDKTALETYRAQLDRRSYQLNAASIQLTNEIVRVWNPNPERAEASRLRIWADGQYLKVVVEDELGVEIELDQRSEGFQWLVSFFVVFFSETDGKHSNAILLLDEPGMSLHALKQRDFRDTISKLAESNQTIYTTHSPFLVGPGELDLVRVVEMKDRKAGTKVHTTITAQDPAALLPLQEALGYDLAQSLFMQQRNLILEGLTDLWYIEATSDLLRAAGIADLQEKIALISANAAGKIVYYATILHANNLKVAALLDSDSAGDQAAQQDALVGTLGHKKIIRTRDVYAGTVARPEIEDLLRETLIALAKTDLGWDVAAKAAATPNRPIVNVFAAEVPDFSKYKLAKAYVRWTRGHEATALTGNERGAWATLIEKINSVLK
jgi:predicted ATPase